MVVVRSVARQCCGSHLLCGNVSCKVPLEIPVSTIGVMVDYPGVGLLLSRVALCELCAKEAVARNFVEVDSDVDYKADVCGL